MRELDKNFGALDELECRKTIDVMEMFHAMQESYKALAQVAQSKIEPRRSIFLGFDMATSLSTSTMFAF